MQFSSIWPIDWDLLSVTTPGQSWLGSNGNEGVLYIPQSSSITGTSLSNCLVSYPGHTLGVLHLCRDAICVFYNLSAGAYNTLTVYPAGEYDSLQKWCPDNDNQTASEGWVAFLDTWECTVPAHCNYCRVYTDLEWYYLLGAYLQVK